MLPGGWGEVVESGTMLEVFPKVGATQDEDRPVVRPRAGGRAAVESLDLRNLDRRSRTLRPGAFGVPPDPRTRGQLTGER